ncbi:50S ribosomal protein L30 [Candidatus Pacearchaeota archaeon]|nr:50S ribosomal protein L30 [Candidatus Pacearchaeota archaeon]
MISVIRISGMVGIDEDVEATLTRLRLGRKYACIILNPNAEIKGMLQKVRAFIAFGEIDKETLKMLVLKRGRLPGNRLVDTKKISDSVIEEIFSGRKKLKDFGMKPFFRLHPPVQGLKKSTKQFYPKGILGNHGARINELLRRML